MEDRSVNAGLARPGAVEYDGIPPPAWDALLLAAANVLASKGALVGVWIPYDEPDWDHEVSKDDAEALALEFPSFGNVLARCIPI